MPSFTDIVSTLRKMGLLQVSTGDYQTGEFDSGPKKKKKNSESEKQSEKKKAAVIGASNPSSKSDNPVLKAFAGTEKWWGLYVGIGLALFFWLISFTILNFFWMLVMIMLWLFVFWLLKVRRTVWSTLGILVISFLVAFFLLGAVADVDTDGTANSGKNGSMSAKKLAGTTETLSSADGGATVTVSFAEPDESGSFMVTFNILVNTELPLNPVCSDNPASSCRGVDNYNYAAGFIRPESASWEYDTVRLFPVLCDGGFAGVPDPSKLTPLADSTCWYGKPGSARTSQFFGATTTSYPSVEEYRKTVENLYVFDAAASTIRSYVYENNTGTSTESMDTEAAFSSGAQVKKFTLTNESGDQ